MSPISIEFKGGLNLYSYCHENPINNIDANGKNVTKTRRCLSVALNKMKSCLINGLSAPTAVELFVLAGCSASCLAVCSASNVAFVPCMHSVFPACVSKCVAIGTGVNTIWVLYKIKKCADQAINAYDECQCG